MIDHIDFDKLLPYKDDKKHSLKKCATSCAWMSMEQWEHLHLSMIVAEVMELNII